MAASTNSPRAVAFLILVLAPCLSPWSAAHHKGYRRAGWALWLWTLAFGHHEDRTPTHGYEPTREAANGGVR